MMDKRKFDKKMIEFPLCCLSYPTREKEKVRKIFAYCLVEFSKKIETAVEQRIEELDEIPYDFDDENDQDKQLILAAKEHNITLNHIGTVLEDHLSVSKYILQFQEEYGNDSYCRIGKDLSLEVMDGKFLYNDFAILCAIQSIIGKKSKYKRITKERIRFAMLGYRSKEIALKEIQPDQKVLSDRQLGTRIELLHSKKFFSKLTYAQRQTFYSTRLEDSELDAAVLESKIYWEKKKSQLRDRQVTELIKSKLKLIPRKLQLKTA